MKNNKNSLSGILLLLFFSLMTISTKAQSVKVFILAGQSNMQGQGDILPADVNGTLTQYMSTDPEEFWYIQDDDGGWIERDDVWVRYKQEDGSVLAENLNVGLGASSNQIGPELSFGHIISEESESRVLIVKTAWGGKSLAVDFRPPSSRGETGSYYDQMISDVREAIDNVERDFANFEAGGEVEIAGFCWFQGWNDGDELAFAEEYEVNLNNLISDVRVDLDVPDLPFVVALTGNGGYELEPEGTWVGNLQHHVLPAQINAIENGGHENVAYVDTREFWPDPDASPEEDFGFHWYNNAESFLRIGAGLGQAMFDLVVGEDQDDEEPGNQDTSFCSCGNCGLESNVSSNSTPFHGIPCLGSVQPNTNMALPASYGLQEYVFPEPDDQVPCQGIENATATIEQVYLAQTHRQPIGHPLQFTIGERPALFQIAVTGTGAAPDVQVEGILNGNSLGTMCLNGPATLSPSIDLATANFDDYFSVTLPKAWITIGLELRLRAGNAERILTQEDLKISPYTELNLVEFDMDIMDYNHEPHRTPVYDNFLQELASAIPASVIRFGKFPEKLRMADFALNNADGNTVVVNTNDVAYDSGLNTGNLNFAANYMVDRVRQALGDTPNTVYFGNTLNLDPGGWGGGGTFVGYEYNDVFIHELGHALSLPHWVEDYRRTNPHAEQYSYPFAGEEGEGSGRGDTWNFIQATYEFVSPRCEDESGILGTERSDAMLRGYYCAERRPSGRGPWDGFGAFSALAMNRYLVGSVNEWGQIEDRGELLDFHLVQNDGYPIASLQNEKRVFSRHPNQPQNTYAEDYIKLPGEEQIEQEAYLITGSAHGTTQAANIIYEPLKYKGTILPIIDPTDSEMFSTLQDVRFDDAPEFFGRTRDITLKLTYIDGTVKHVLVPFASFDRPDQFPDEDLQPKYFAVSVPADKLLCNVEMYHRDFIIYDEFSQERGNINDPAQNITAANFMNEAVLMASLDHSCNCPGTPDYIAPGTPCDDGNPYTINDVEDGFCNCEGTQIASCGEIDNSAFTESLAGWRYWGIEAESINEVATITISNVNDAGFGFEPIEVSMGESYTLKFEAYAEENRSLTVIHKAQYDFENDEEGVDFLNTTFDLTTTKTEYEVSYTATENDRLSFLEFNFSGNEAGLYIDNVCFDFGCSPIEIPYNGIDDDCNATTLDDDLDQDGFDLVDDCNDNDPDINPNQTEEPDNGIDDDCNPETLDTDVIDEEIASCGIINNGQFDENLDSWWTWGSEVSIVNGEAVFENVDLDDSGIAQGPLEFSSNTPYNLTFSAYASETRNIEVIIYLDEEPYTEYYRAVFVLSSLSQDYQMPFTFSGSSITNGAIAFEMKGDNTTVFLDNVCLDVVACKETEIAYNGIDDDCNPATLDDDLDRDGFPLVFDCDDNNPNINPGVREEPYNSIDDDCNTSTLDDDLDQDGFGFVSDCDDSDPNINPDANDQSGNAIDENCDGFLGQVLPVSYLTFTGELLEETIRLTWEIAKEVNVSYYVIERALQDDTDEYEEIGEVEAEELDVYSFEDIYPHEGANYYRIKSVDLNGDISYSNVISVVLNVGLSGNYADHKLKRSLVIFPNPVLDRLNISTGKLVQIVDASGRQYTPSQDVSGIPAGIYFAKVQVENTLIVKKFIKE